MINSEAVKMLCYIMLVFFNGGEKELHFLNEALHTKVDIKIVMLPDAGTVREASIPFISPLTCGLFSPVLSKCGALCLRGIKIECNDMLCTS